MRTIAICNAKGGVGKTTTCLNLGAGLAQSGHRVLLVDCDPQGNLTSCLGVVPPSSHPCLAEVLCGEATVAAAGMATGWPGISLVPSSPRLNEINRRNLAGERVLLARLSEHSDYTLLDCPGGLGVVQINALTAASEVIVPVQAKGMARPSLERLISLLEDVRMHSNPRLDLTGILVNHFDGRTRLAQSIVDELRADFGPLVFHTMIHEAVRVSEAADHFMPVSHYAPGSRSADEFEALANEVVQRAGGWVRYFGHKEERTASRAEMGAGNAFVPSANRLFLHSPRRR